jgi:hypothetical protein
MPHAAYGAVGKSYHTEHHTHYVSGPPGCGIGLLLSILLWALCLCGFFFEWGAPWMGAREWVLVWFAGALAMFMVALVGSFNQ